MRIMGTAFLTSLLLAMVTQASMATEPTKLTKEQSPTVTATPLGDAPFRIVSYRDLDLSRDADAKILAHRIRRAIEIVCETHNSRNIMRIRECRDDALAEAKNQVLMQTAVSLAATDPVSVD